MENLVPVLKWVGGKRQLMDSLIPLLPKKIGTYCEPFLGGGAMLFKLAPRVAIASDINAELMRVYKVIKEDVDALIKELEGYENTKSAYYAVRNIDRDATRYEELPDVTKASRVIFMNKTCYNGLYRVNSSGNFNAPYGFYPNPNIVNEVALRTLSAYLNSCDVTLRCQGYEKTLACLPEGSFAYLDPPYDPVSESANFTSYSRDKFSREDQVNLKLCCDRLHECGHKFMLSNSATNFIKELYAGYNITIVKANRYVNVDSSKRGKVDEVVVRNYE
ncbi:MAG: DNA adenine methylase [Clostridiales bacterium]|nr:DNA adenine methylase [Clostridiales bacterium]MDR2749555.1 DNA adenine methylase [Clostridiales bacterium]